MSVRASSHRLGRLCAAVLMVGASGGLAGCGGDDTASPRVTRSPSGSASAVQTPSGGPVKVVVRGIRGPVDVRGNELGVVLFRGHPPTVPVRQWEALGGSSVVVNDDGSVPAQYVRRPDPGWRHSAGPFPYVLPEVLTVPPGTYELYFWLSAGTLQPDVGGDEGQSRQNWPRRWFPAPWGAPPDPEHTFIVGACRATFTVEGPLGATVRVWVQEFTQRTGLDFSMTCPTA